MQRNTVILAMGALIVGLVVGYAGGRASAPGVDGADGPTLPQSPTPGSDVPVIEPTTEATSPPPPDESSLSVGEQGADAAITVRLKSVSLESSIQLRQDYGAQKPLEPVQNAKLVQAKLELENSGQKSIDPYCAFDFGMRLVDTEQRAFDPVEDQYLIPGNQGCNDLLQPGFSTAETVVFQIPATASTRYLEFWDPNDGQDSFGESSKIQFSVPEV